MNSRAVWAGPQESSGGSVRGAAGRWCAGRRPLADGLELLDPAWDVLRRADGSVNVLAAMISSGEIFSAKLWRTTTSDAFSGFLSLLHEHVGKPLTVILDNASIHKAKSEQHIIKHLESQGLTLYFLPPYSPELNRIERLWHKMKYTWMAAKCRDSTQLEADIDDILSNFWTKFKLSF